MRWMSSARLSFRRSGVTADELRQLFGCGGDIHAFAMALRQEPAHVRMKGDGFVEQEAGEIVADLGSGLFF